MELSALFQMSISGAFMGLIYALIAYGFQLTHATSKAINFGQGELVMLSAFAGLTLLKAGLPFALMVPLTLLFGAFLGLVVERVAVRLALEQKTEGWILLTIILGLFGVSAAENIWGRDDRAFPTPLPSESLLIGGVSIAPAEIAVAVGAFAIMTAVEIFKRRTLLGKAVEAVAADRDVAELVGINSRAVIALSFALSGMVAACAGLLAAPIITVGPTMASALVLKAFAVAVVAGLDSGFGIVLAGVALGCMESLAAYGIGSGWREAPGLILLILALAIRPQGVFGKPLVKKV